MNRKQILTFIAMGIGILAIAVDLTSINVAIPAIQKSFNVSIETVEWMISGFMLAFGVLLVTAGRLADTYGRKKIFLIGMAIFGAASLVGGLSQDAGLLIAMRVMQGVGGSILWPSVIGITFASVSKQHKGLAMGLVFGIAGIGNSLGPLVGGILTEDISWRWVLFANVPMAVIAVFITYFIVDEQSGENIEKRIDFPGIATISIALVSFLYAINQSTSWGWLSEKTVGLLIVSAVSIFLFFKLERNKENALIPADVMKNGQFMRYCLTISVLAPTFFLIFLYLPQYLEKFLGFSPIEAGAGVVPAVITFAIMSPFAGKVFNALGARMSIFLGMLITAIGTFGLVFFGFKGAYINMVLPCLICGVGIGIALACINTAAVGSVDESRASLAGGLTMLFQMGGAALGIAIVTTIFVDTSINDLLAKISSLGIDIPQSGIQEIKSFIVGSGTEQALKEQIGLELYNKLLPHIEASYIKGLRIGLGFTGFLLLIGTVYSFFHSNEQN